jgi:hypothetical protein
VFTVRYELQFLYYLEYFKPSHSSPSIRRLVAVLSPRTPGFYTRTFQMKFMTGQSGTVASFFLRVPLFSCVSYQYYSYCKDKWAKRGKL